MTTLTTTSATYLVSAITLPAGTEFESVWIDSDSSSSVAGHLLAIANTRLLVDTDEVHEEFVATLTTELTVACDLALTVCGGGYEVDSDVIFYYNGDYGLVVPVEAVINILSKLA